MSIKRGSLTKLEFKRTSVLKGTMGQRVINSQERGFAFGLGIGQLIFLQPAGPATFPGWQNTFASLRQLLATKVTLSNLYTIYAELHRFI